MRAGVRAHQRRIASVIIFGGPGRQHTGKATLHVDRTDQRSFSILAANGAIRQSGPAFSENGKNRAVIRRSEHR
jgi:hypothetical protein